MSQHLDRKGRTPPPAGRAARIGLESLEDRTVLSAMVYLSGTNFKQEHILVQYQTGQTPVALPGTSVSQSVTGLQGLYKVNLRVGTNVEQALKAYRADPRVLYAEPDYELSTSATSNDTRLSDQWALQNTGQSSGKVGSDIGATSAWNAGTGSTKMIVSVMDTGIDYTHPDLYLNIYVNQGEIPSTRKANFTDIDRDGLITFRDLNDTRNQGLGKITDLNGNGYIDLGDLLEPTIKDASGKDTGRGGWSNGVSEDGNEYVDDISGWNYVNNTNDPMDDFGHGTHVAGTIGALGNNGKGVAGINWSIQLMPIKFMSATGAGSMSSFITGLNYAIDRGAKISNNSWTGAGESTLLTTAVANTRTRGHLFVAAAGNYANNNDASPTYPASFTYDNIISVAATDRNDQLASFSNYGAQSVDLAAPGVDILSTTLGGGYGYNSGTSMATPHVTGAAALLWSLNPTWTYQQVSSRLLTSVDKVAGLTGKVATGGRLDIGKAIGATTTTATAPRVVTATWSGSVANSLNKLRVTFDQAITLTSFTAADVKITSPAGATISITSVKVVSGTSDRTFDITFAAQSAAGTYRGAIGPEVTSLTGAKMSSWSGTTQIAAAAPVSSPTITAATWSGPATNQLNKVRVTFSRAINTASFTTADVKLTSPTGQTLPVTSVMVVAGTSNKTFDITFSTQTVAGTYKIVVGPEVTDSAGVKMVAWTGTKAIAPPAAPPTITAATWSGPATNQLNKVRVTFSQAINTASFTTADVKLTSPTGQTLPVTSVMVVAGTSNKTFDITFSTQTVAGTYKIVVGPEVTDSAGVKMIAWSGTAKINAPVSTSTSTVAQTYTSAAKVTVMPGGRAVSLLLVTDTAVIADLNVRVNITHPRISDLYIYLQAPDGTTVVLANRAGGATANMTNTVFDSQAAATIGTGKGPFTGSFSPVGSLGVLNGKDIRGTWKLWVEDRGGVNRGSLDNWSLIMTKKVGTTATTAQADAMAQAYQASQRKNAGGIG